MVSSLSMIMGTRFAGAHYRTDEMGCMHEDSVIPRTSAFSAMRIAHLIESDGPGGAERVVAQLATSLQAAGTENVVFLPAHGEGWLAEQLRGSGVAIEHFHVDRPLSPSCARSLTEAFRRHRITVAHSHEFSMAVYGA